MWGIHFDNITSTVILSLPGMKSEIRGAEGDKFKP
jgi:hypothetical protein